MKQILKIKIGLSLVLILCCVTIKADAHTIVLSEYTLKNEGNNWSISFHQKTSQLRDAVYELNPHLIGKSLNSPEFLDATFDLIKDRMRFTLKGRSLSLEKEVMTYGGLRFEAIFNLKGLPTEPEYLKIKTSGFDDHDDSIHIINIYNGNLGKSYFFNRKKTETIYGFNEMKFDSSESSTSANWRFNLILLLVITGAVVLLLSMRHRKLLTLNM